MSVARDDGMRAQDGRRRRMRYKQNYKEKQEQEKAALAALGLVSDRYAGISHIEFQMTYFQRGLDPVLMKRTLSFLPTDYANFHMKCMQEGCTDGGYDLAPVVASLAKSGKPSAKGKILCRGKNGVPGHASIAYEVNIQYIKKSR
jgi:hypothetical protein